MHVCTMHPSAPSHSTSNLPLVLIPYFVLGLITAELLEDKYEDFESLDNIEKSSYVLGSEL